MSFYALLHKPCLSKCSQMKQKAAEKLCGSYISSSRQPSEGCGMMHWKFIKLTRALCEMSVREARSQ